MPNLKMNKSMPFAIGGKVVADLEEGKTYDLSDADAAVLIEAGHAESAESGVVEQEKQEATTQEPTDEPADEPAETEDKKCTKCNGTGIKPRTKKKACAYCDGTGKAK